MDPSKVLENRNGELYIDGASALKLAERFDTPLYVISEQRIRGNYRRLRSALAKHYGKIRIYYAAKANTNIAVLRLLRGEGAYVDAVSPGEVFLTLEAGFKPSEILFTGTSLREDELRTLVRSKVTINIDALSQLNKLLKITVPKLLSVRVNPEVGAGHHEHCITAGKDSKFGIWEEDVVQAYRIARKAGVTSFGIHMHIGSGILTPQPFLLAGEKLLNIARRVHAEVGVDFEFIDFGGGLGIPYKPEEDELDLEEFSSSLLEIFKQRIREYGLGEPVFCLEPGRYIVGDAVILLTRVNTVKVTPIKKFIGVDAGFNTLIRPAMYGSYHHIMVANKLNHPNSDFYEIAGPLCESGDLLARSRELPRIEEGDLLAVLNAGAYGYSMSSQYNSRPRAAEVLVNRGKATLIRRRETVRSLLAGQRL